MPLRSFSEEGPKILYYVYLLEAQSGPERRYVGLTTDLKQRLDACVGQGVADGLFVIDHESKMTAVVCGLGATLLERQELIAEIDEGGGFTPAAKFEFEQATVKRKRLIDITDLESDMVETDGARLLCLRHSDLRSFVP